MVAVVHVEHVEHVQAPSIASARAHQPTPTAHPIVIHVGVSSVDQLGRYRSWETPTFTQRLRHAGTLNHA